MRKTKMKTKILTLLMGISVIFSTEYTKKDVFAAENIKEKEWYYEYTGTEQEFTAPYAGIYQFALNGAQGSNSTKEGGKGGNVTVSLKLKKGDKITVVVGGQDGYNGGGIGKVSNGGGATDIRINGEMVAIAGGGGGGTAKKEGGAGGASKSGNNNTKINGSSSTASGTAGGGGGYYGGKAGRYVAEHTHSGSTLSGGGCYSTTIKCNSTDWTYVGDNLTEMGDFYRRYECNTCSHQNFIDKENAGDDFRNYRSACTGYKLICTQSTSGANTASFGGSNWYDELTCINKESKEGTQEGNGNCSVNILSFYNIYYNNIECINVYYNGVKAKNVYYNGTQIYRE